MATPPTMTLPDGRVGVLQPPVHACPGAGDGGIMPCCGRTPFEVPRTHRMTATETVTCGQRAIVYRFPVS